MIIVARNTGINGMEYLLDADGDCMKFESQQEAETFLRGKGAADEDLYYMEFIDTDNEKAG